MNKELTICTVSFNSKHWLELSHNLLAQNNPNTNLTWIVAENSPANSSQKFAFSDPRFTVIEGSTYINAPYGAGSLHHASALNKTLDHIKTRYALFLDPDYFIVANDIINAVLQHMLSNGISFFGAPWHPRWYRKFRYFPCVHCLFVDLHTVPKSNLDFMPEFNCIPKYVSTMKTHDSPHSSVNYLLNSITDPLNFRQRKFIGKSKDVSWRIYNSFYDNSQFKSECTQPVYQPTRHWTRRLIDSVLPDCYSFVPKRDGYFTTLGFKDRGLADLSAFGWEEFIWRDKPFGFHIRSQPKISDAQSLSSHYEMASAFLRTHVPNLAAA